MNRRLRERPAMHGDSAVVRALREAFADTRSRLLLVAIGVLIGIIVFTLRVSSIGLQIR
jgi:hypothetical protein